MNAVIYARVSSREQEREGYSIPAQRKLLSEYARKTGLNVDGEFIDVESAKNPGRKHFGEMLNVLRTDSETRVVLVEKTDRLYRNRTDSLAFEELIETKDVEIHLVKENRVISKNSRSQDKFMHDIHVAVAKNYSENLREEVKKGMREKAEQGMYPGRAPFGYKNDSATRSLRLDPEKAAALRRLFELYATGDYSLTSLRKKILEEMGVRLCRAYLETILKNRFYIGYFTWAGITYKGTYEPLIDGALFERVQRVFSNHNKPKYRKHEFAFAGLLRCAHDGCTVTTELQKKKYVYYRCSHGRGKCVLPYMQEAKISDQLGELLKAITVPEHVALAIVNSIEHDQGSAEAERLRRLSDAQQRLSALRTRMDRMYDDKLDGKIDEEFWTRKMADWRSEEQALQSAVDSLNRPIPENRALTVQRIFELANRAHFLYLTRNHTERGRLLKSVLLNCATDGVSLTPTFRKPFDVIFERAKREEWSGREDLNLRLPGPEPDSSRY